VNAIRAPGFLAALVGAAASVGAQDAGTVAAIRSPAVSTIQGAVFDSIALRPMASAVVQLVRLGERGTPLDTRSVHADSAGRYEFTHVAVGTYLLGFQHLTIDTLGFRAPVHRIDVRRPGVMRIALAVPSMASIVRRVCGAASAKDSASLLVGSVRHARADLPIPNAYVSIKWAEVTLTRTGLVRETPTHDLRTNDEGWYSACVPSGVPVTAHAELDSLRSGDVDVVLSTLGVLRRDLYVGVADRVIVGANDSVRTSGAVEAGDRLVARGPGVISGTVRGTDGKALANARVSLVGGAGESRTDESGRFVLRGLPEGTQSVEARLLGYIPEQTMVDVVAFRESTVEIMLLDLRSTLLDTVRVQAMRQMEERARAGFERRRKSGVGIFIDESVTDTINAHTFSDLVRSVPGIRFMEGQGQFDRFERQVEFLRGRGAPCPPQIFVDGVKLLRGVADLDEFLDVRSVRRVEVYPRGATPPAEFASPDVACGLLAVWTGPPPLRRAARDSTRGRW
jgi:hypothetical protein